MTQPCTGGPIALSRSVTLLLVCTALVAAACPAESPRREQAVDSGRKALDGGADYPWYDTQNDCLRRIDAHPPKETAVNRDSTWQAR